MMKKLAIPTREGMVDDHFGHCAYYTIVTAGNMGMGGLQQAFCSWYLSHQGMSRNGRRCTPGLFGWKTE